MFETLINSIKSFFVYFDSTKADIIDFLDNLDDTTRPIIDGLFLILVLLPLIFLLMKNFGKVLIFIVATIGILILLGFIALWTGIFIS